MSINPDLTEVRRLIDGLLRARRPDRYVVRADDDDDLDLDAGEVATTAWLDDLAEEVEPHVPRQSAIRLFARSEVGRAEGKATRRVNDLLRRIHRSGQLPIDWLEMRNDPMAVVERLQQSGERVKVTEERVALRAVTAQDLLSFAVEERRRAGRDFAARNDACAGAEWVASQMLGIGSATFDEWASRP